MPTDNPVRGLGVYMRQVARCLHPEKPVTVTQALDAIYPKGPNVDLGYALSTLHRLKRRGIAHEPHWGLWVQGPRWSEAAAYYGWENPK